MRRRRVLTTIALLVLALAVPLAAACRDDASPAAGRLVFVRIIEAGDSELVGIDFHRGGSESVIERDVALTQFGFAPVKVPAFSFVRASGEIVLFEFMPEARSSAAQGTGAIINDRFKLAYCDDENRIALRDLTFDRPDVITPPHDACPSMAWGHGGLLAFISPEPAGGFSLFRVNHDLSVERVHLPEELPSNAAISWSVDDTTLALSLDDGVALVDLTTATLAPFRASGAAKFSPVAADLLAVLAPDGSLFVYDSGSRVASRAFGAGARDLSWSPDGEWLAIVADGEITIWRWRTGHRQIVARARNAEFAPAIAWLP